MNQPQQFQKSYISTQRSSESVVKSVWTSSPSEQRQPTFYENKFNNSTLPSDPAATTNQIYKSQILINLKPSTSSDVDVVSRCDKCKCVIDINNETKIKFNNHDYHINCFTCSNCQANLNNSTNNRVKLNDNGEAICSACELSQAKICYICNEVILTGEIITFDQKHYHKNCFNCAQCRKSLTDQTNLHIYNSKACCFQCYEQYFAPRCDQCFQPISIGKSISFDEKKYHFDCFRCGQCNEIIVSKELTTYNGKPCCVQCYDKYVAPQCATCLKGILSGKITIFNGNKHHPECFRCNHCDKMIIEKEFSINNGKPYCIQCYDQHFAPKCFQCSKSISGEKSTVYNENNYHPECFRCIQCNQMINQSKFHTHNSKPCCTQCYNDYFTLRCEKCSKPILDRYTTFQGTNFHIQCFVCEKCHRIIEGKDKVYNGHSGILCSTCAV